MGMKPPPTGDDFLVTANQFRYVLDTLGSAARQPRPALALPVGHLTASAEAASVSRSPSGYWMNQVRLTPSWSFSLHGWLPGEAPFEYPVTGTCPACREPYVWTMRIYIDEAAEPAVFRRALEVEFHCHVCHNCAARIYLEYPLFVQRRWPRYPCLLVTGGGLDAGSSTFRKTVELARRRLRVLLPRPAGTRVSTALPVPTSIFTTWGSIDDEPSDPAAFLGELAGERLLDLLDGFEHRLDPVARFPDATAYRRREFEAWLRAPDNEAVVERRAETARLLFVDLKVVDQVSRFGQSACFPSTLLGARVAMQELERSALQERGRDAAVSTHNRAVQSVRRADRRCRGVRAVPAELRHRASEVGRVRRLHRRLRPERFPARRRRAHHVDAPGGGGRGDRGRPGPSW